MNDLAHELTALDLRLDLLKTRFYQRWTAGELTMGELSDYACQYGHLVRAVPRWLELAGVQDPRQRELLNAHAAEESEHVALWELFGSAIGVTAGTMRSEPANPATAELLAQCESLAAAGQGAAVVRAIEAQSSRVSAQKLAGLTEHYGIGAENGGQYFALHQGRDIEHERELRQVIEAQPMERRAESPAATEAVLSGLWKLLGSVEATPTTGPAALA